MKLLRNCLLAIGLLTPFVSANGAGWGRISFIDGDVFIIGVDDDRWGYATINTIVEEGDIIRTEAGSRVEVQLSDGTVVRLDELSEAEFTVMEEDGTTLVTTVYGIVAASVPYWTRMRYLHIAFTGGDVEPYRGSKVRVEVDDNGDSYVIVRKEGAILHYADGRRVLRTHRIAYINADGDLVWTDRYYDRDAFDRWCDMRDRDVLRRPSSDYYGEVRLGLYIHVGLSELDMYGRWRRVPGYGLVWVPYVDASWRPYANGHWVWSSRWGWVWVPYEPWGWVPFHYGRWAFVAGVGWIWVPGYDFAPAWVAWSYGPDWIAWAPLDPWGNPIIVINNITIINIVDRRSFCDPIYRYRPPVKGRYTKPYRTSSVKVNTGDFTKKSRWTTKPPIDYAKPTPPPPKVKTQLVSERVKTIEVIEKSPISKLKPSIVSAKIERETKLNPALKSKVTVPTGAIDRETPAPRNPRVKKPSTSRISPIEPQTPTDAADRRTVVPRRPRIKRPSTSGVSPIETPKPSDDATDRDAKRISRTRRWRNITGEVNVGNDRSDIPQRRVSVPVVRNKADHTDKKQSDRRTNQRVIFRRSTPSRNSKSKTDKEDTGSKIRSSDDKKKDRRTIRRSTSRSSDRVHRRTSVRKTDDKKKHRTIFRNGINEEVGK